MMRFGCALIVLGFALCVAGIVAVGFWLFDPWAAREVKQEQIPIGQPVVTEVLPVQPGGRCALKVVATVHANQAVYRKDGAWEDVDDKRLILADGYEPKYRFPVVYRILDENKQEVADLSGAFTYDEQTHESADFSDVGLKGGTAKVGVQFPTFTAPPSGKVRIEFTMFPDAGNGATAEKPTLQVLDHIPQSPERTTATILAPFVGLGMLAAGFVVFCVGAVGWLYRQIVGPPPRRPQVVVVL